MNIPANSDAAANRPLEPRSATRILRDILRDLPAASPVAGAAPDAPDAPQAKLGDIIDGLDERAFGLLILLLALPCCLPFVYLLPQVVALPMLALAGQMALGRKRPWLPRALHERPFSPLALDKVVARSEKYVGWVERLARPRLAAITGALGVRIVGVLLLIPTASILIPLPSTNTIPGIGVAIASLGLIERDGLLVILGLVVGFAWVGLLLFVGLEASQFIKDWFGARL